MGKKKLLIYIPIENLTDRSERWIWARQRRAITQVAAQQMLNEDVSASKKSDISKLESDPGANVSQDVQVFLSCVYGDLKGRSLNLGWVLNGVGEPYITSDGEALTQRDREDLDTLNSGWDELRNSTMKAYKAAVKGRPES